MFTILTVVAGGASGDRRVPGQSGCFFTVKTTKKVSGAGRSGVATGRDCRTAAAGLHNYHVSPHTSHLTSSRLEVMEVMVAMEVVGKIWREWRVERESHSVSTQLCVSLSEWRPPTLAQPPPGIHTHTTHLHQQRS